MIKLTYKAKQELSSTETQMKIALDCNRTQQTVCNWVKHSHENLSKRRTINAIIKHTKLTESQIFES